MDDDDVAEAIVWTVGFICILFWFLWCFYDELRRRIEMKSTWTFNTRTQTNIYMYIFHLINYLSHFFRSFRFVKLDIFFYFKLSSAVDFFCTLNNMPTSTVTRYNNGAFLLLSLPKSEISVCIDTSIPRGTNHINHRPTSILYTHT